MNDFLEGFIKGAWETPKAYFAPAIAVWRLLLGVTYSLLDVDSMAYVADDGSPSSGNMR